MGKWRVCVQNAEYHSKNFEVDAASREEADEKAVAAAEKELIDDNEPVNWNYVGQDIEAFNAADVTGEPAVESRKIPVVSIGQGEYRKDWYG